MKKLKADPMQALELRNTGLSFDKIGAAMGCTRTQAQYAVKVAVKLGLGTVQKAYPPEPLFDSLESNTYREQ